MGEWIRWQEQESIATTYILKKKQRLTTKIKIKTRLVYGGMTNCLNKHVKGESISAMSLARKQYRILADDPCEHQDIINKTLCRCMEGSDHVHTGDMRRQARSP